MLCLLLVGRRKKIKIKKREAAGGFFPKAGGETYLAAVPGGIFMAVRHN
jgi:hypothetical protein